MLGNFQTRPDYQPPTQANLDTKFTAANSRRPLPVLSEKDQLADTVPHPGRLVSAGPGYRAVLASGRFSIWRYSVMPMAPSP